MECECVSLYKLQCKNSCEQWCFRLVNAKYHFDLVELFGLKSKIKY